jgi:hypothetical protein
MEKRLAEQAGLEQGVFATPNKEKARRRQRAFPRNRKPSED